VPGLALSSGDNERQAPTTNRHAHRDMEQPTGQDGRASTRGSSFQAPRKKRNHRGGKKKRSTKQSFASPDEEEDVSAVLETSEDRKTKQSTARSPLHRLQGRNSSNTSLESEALLDHRYVYGVLFPA
jgi:hypothetical protein